MSPTNQGLCGGGRTARVRRKCVSAALLSRTAAKVTLIAGCILSISLPVHSADLSKLSPDLAKELRGGNGGSRSLSDGSPQPKKLRVLIRSRQPLTQGLRSRYLGQVAQLGRSFARLNTAVAVVTPQQLAALSSDPTIASISPDRPVAGAAQLDVNPRTVGADVAGQAYPGSSGARFDGRGVGVAVIDSGVAPVADIAPRIAAFQDFVNGRALPYDDHGHGTHVAGIIAGSGLSSSGTTALKTYRGIAPGAHIVGAKVLDAQGRGSVSNVIAAIDWVIANRAALNIRVINLSLGSSVRESYTTDPLCQAAEKAVAAGIVVVASAGNKGGIYGGVTSPANDPGVIAVGASNSRGTANRGDDVITTYTARGPGRYDLGIKPDLLAPGNRVVSLRAPGSTLDVQYPDTRVATSEYDASTLETAYTRLSGTSMAAPSVAGAAAIAIQANGALQPNGVKAALMYSAQLLSGYDPVLQSTGVYDPLTQGAGLLNVPGAVEIASLMAPGVGLTGAPSLRSVIEGSTVVWAGAGIRDLLERPGSVYADNLIWGATGDDPEAWASNLIWGATGDDPPPNATWNDDIVWGGNLIWGATGDEETEPATGYEMVWGNNLIWGATGDEEEAGTPPPPPPPPPGDEETEGNNLIWGATGDDEYVPSGDGLVNANNLIWGATGDEEETAPPPPSDAEGNNLIWGGTGDDPEIWANNLIWGATGDE